MGRAQVAGKPTQEQPQLSLGCTLTWQAHGDSLSVNSFLQAAKLQSPHSLQNEPLRFGKLVTQEPSGEQTQGPSKQVSTSGASSLGDSSLHLLLMAPNWNNPPQVPTICLTEGL